jgi:hypothetical protein
MMKRDLNYIFFNYPIYLCIIIIYSTCSAANVIHVYYFVVKYDFSHIINFRRKHNKDCNPTKQDFFSHYKISLIVKHHK